jgi:hypothetical protein
MIRASRLAMTPSSAAMPVSRKTGAIASWIAWAMIGMFCGCTGRLGEDRRWRVV